MIYPLLGHLLILRMIEKIENYLENCFELHVYKSPIFVCAFRGEWLQYISFAARFICILPYTGLVWRVSEYDSSFQIQRSKITTLPLAYNFSSVCLAFLQLMFQDGIFKWILVYSQAPAHT